MEKEDGRRSRRMRKIAAGQSRMFKQATSDCVHLRKSTKTCVFNGTTRSFLFISFFSVQIVQKNSRLHRI